MSELKKTKLGKKTYLGKTKEELKENNEEILVVGNNININQKENNASFLLKLILKAFYLSIWKKKIKALKYFSRKTNKQRMNFKKLINEISLAIEHCKFNYFNEIIEKVNKLPIPKNIKHDKNFGTLKIVNKEFINKKNINNNKININKGLEQNIKGKKYLNQNQYVINNNQKNIYDKYNSDINDNKEKYINNNIKYNYNNYNNENQIEEDDYFIENEYDYNQDINNNDEEYYQEDYYYDEQDNNNYYNNYNDMYYQNQYNNYYYKEPYEEMIYQNEYENNLSNEPINKVEYIKNTGNNIILNDVYVKPRIEKNKYFYNKNTESYNDRNNKNNNRLFPFSTHNYVFYISK